MEDETPARPNPGALTVKFEAIQYTSDDAGSWSGAGTVWTGTCSVIGIIAPEPDSVAYDGSGGFDGDPDNTPCDPFTLSLPYP